MTVVPVPAIVPTLLLPLTMPSTVHVKASLAVFCTAATNCCAPFSSRLAEVGLMLTAAAGVTLVLLAGDVGELVEVEDDPDPQVQRNSVSRRAENA